MNIAREICTMKKAREISSMKIVREIYTALISTRTMSHAAMLFLEHTRCFARRVEVTCSFLKRSLYKQIRTVFAALFTMDSFYLNLTSKSSVFKGNTPSSFIVQIRPEINITRGAWCVSLVELFLPRATEFKPKYLTASFIQSSVVGESKQQLLRIIYDDKQHLTFPGEYIPVTDALLDTLEFEIKDENGNTLDFVKEEEGGNAVTHIRLHFRRV